MYNIRPSLYYNEEDYSIFDRMNDFEESPSSGLLYSNLESGLDIFPSVVTTVELDGAYVSTPMSFDEKLSYYTENGPLILDCQRNLVDQGEIPHDISSISKDFQSARFLYQATEIGYEIPELAYGLFDLAYLLDKVGYVVSDCLAFTFAHHYIIINLTEGGHHSILHTDVWEFFNTMWDDQVTNPEQDIKDYVQSSVMGSPIMDFIDDFGSSDGSSSNAITSVFLTVVGHSVVKEIEYPCTNYFIVADLLNYVRDKLGTNCSLWFACKNSGFKFHPDMEVNIMNDKLRLYVESLEPDIFKRYSKYVTVRHLLSSCYWENDYVFILPRRYRPLAEGFYSEARYHCFAYISKAVAPMGVPSISRMYGSRKASWKNRSCDRSLDHNDWMTLNFEDYHRNDVSYRANIIWSSFLGAWVPTGVFFMKKLRGSYNIRGKRVLSGSYLLLMYDRTSVYAVHLYRHSESQVNNSGELYAFMKMLYDSPLYSYLSPEIVNPSQTFTTLCAYLDIDP